MLRESQSQRSNVVNQWGRDGTSSSGGGRSGGGILIPALVALVIGGAGGYAGGRYFSGVSTSDIQSRDKKIVELQQSLSELKFNTDSADTQQVVMRERVKELEGQVAAANRIKETLRADIDKQVAAAKSQAQAEIEALQKTLDEAGDVNGQLGRARKSLKVSELQIIELEKLTVDQKAQIDALQKAADASGGEAAATLAALKKTNANLRAALDDTKQKLSAIPRLEDEIAGLKEQLSQKVTDAGSEARNQIAALQKDKDSLQRQLSDALKASGDVDAKARQITELRKQLDDITGQLADRDEAARDAEKDLKKAEADLEKSEQRATSLESENEALRDAQGELAKQVDALKAELVNVTVKPVDDTKPLNDKPANNGLKARDRDEVEQAVADLPGFDNLSDAKQQNLVAMLEKGECVTTSLKAAYGHVPAVALRNLIRELGGRC
jgi:chromosome segregation ATPase